MRYATDILVRAPGREQKCGKRFDVLRSSRKCDLLVGTFEVAQLQSSESKMLLQVTKAHLDFLALSLGAGERSRLSQGSRRFAHRFVPVARTILRLGADLHSALREHTRQSSGPA